MKKLSVLTAAIAAGVLTIAASVAQAEQFDPRKVQRVGDATTQSEASTPKAKAAAKASASKKATRAKTAQAKTIKAKAVSKGAAKTASKATVKYSNIISRYAAAYGVPSSLAHAVIKVESNYRENVVGRAGEIGLMQIKPSTARMMGYSGSAKGLFNPETNIKYGMKYLAMAHDLGGGTTCGTILKYNAGHAAKRMNPISSAYCSKVKVQIAALGSSI